MPIRAAAVSISSVTTLIHMNRNDRVHAKVPIISIQSRYAAQNIFTRSLEIPVDFLVPLPDNTPFPFPHAIDRNSNLAIVLKFSI